MALAMPTSAFAGRLEGPSGAFARRLRRLLAGAPDEPFVLDALAAADGDESTAIEHLDTRDVCSEQIADGLTQGCGVLLPLAKGKRRRGSPGRAVADELERHDDQPTTSKAAARHRRWRASRTPEQRREAQRKQLERTTRRREALVIELAPDLCCAECGEQFDHPQWLQIDHVNGKAWTARKLSPSSRVARYWREYLAGIPMRALCGACNCRDGWYKRHGLATPSDDEVPF